MRAHGNVAVIAHLRGLVELRRAAGLPRVAAAGAATSGARLTLALPFGAALQAATLRVEDLEEQCGGAVVLEVDREGALRMANPRDLSPAVG